MVSLGPKDKEVGLDNSDEDEDDMYVEPPPPRMKNLTEVVDCLEDISVHFLSRTVMQKKQLGLMSY